MISLPFALYIDDKYIHRRPDHSICVSSHSRETQFFLQTKYKWLILNFHLINWNINSSCFHSLPNSVRDFSLRFIHHYLPIENMIFDYPHSYPHYNLTFNSSSLHDHYFISFSCNWNKPSRLQHIIKNLSRLHTLPSPTTTY